MMEYPSKEELQAIRDRVRNTPPDRRQQLANEYIEQGAPGIVFEYMHRGGWRPASQLAGDGIVGGELDPPIIDQRTGRQRGKGRKK